MAKIELYRKHRPKNFKLVKGQDAAIASLQRMIDRDEVPHGVLFTGPSGVGKTTLANILASHLECGSSDFYEVNCADLRGIEEVRAIRKRMRFAPISGKTRVWLIDEAHKLTNDAQNALLMMLENAPNHVYFMLATTDPAKLLKTIHGRCAEIKLSALKPNSIKEALQRVIEKEELKVTDEVLDAIVEACDASARKALMILQQVGGLDTPKEQIEAIQTTTFNKDAAINLARALFNPRGSFSEAAKILQELEDQDAEGIRYCVLGYARKVLLGGGGGAHRAFVVIDCFGRNFYDSKHAGLAAACYEVFSTK